MVASEVEPPVLHLFGGPHVTQFGQHREVPQGCQRLLAFTALHGNRVERRHAAGTLWPTGDDNRAAGNLRTALWRLRGAGIDLLQVDKWSLAIRADVRVDVRDAGHWAARVIAGRATPEDLAVPDWSTEALDLLPGWYDDWTLLERERLRHQVMHALDALSHHLIRIGRYAEAVEAAMTAVSADPLRESAQRTLIEAHLADGNWSEGHRGFLAYRDVLRRELDAEPSADLISLLRTTRRPMSYAPGA